MERCHAFLINVVILLLPCVAACWFTSCCIKRPALQILCILIVHSHYLIKTDLLFKSLLDWLQGVCIHLQEAKNKSSNSHGWNYLVNTMVWADVEYSQGTIKDAFVIQKTPREVYMIKKGKDKSLQLKRHPFLSNVYCLLLAFCLLI